MKHNMFRKLGLVTLLAIPMVAGSGCDAVKGVADSVCCKDFKVGADLSAVDWEIEGEGKAEFAAFMQASGDFSASASGLVLELSTLCQNVAVDMGIDEKKVQETDPGARAAAWCGEVVAQLKAAGSISIDAQPPSCSLSASASASCQAKCSGNASCELQPGELPQCEGGEVSFSCEGSCSGSCQGSADLAVTCEGECSGTCEGSCEGTCEGGLSGTCSGDCSGTCNGKGDGAGGKFSGKCDGTCEGSCSVQFTNPVCKGSCKGSCAGKCRGSCKAAADVKLQCEGECSGSCDGTVKAPKCSGGKLPKAKCEASAECSGSCNASVQAKAECKPGSLKITAAGTLSARAVASLEANLPKIRVLLEAKAKLLADNAAVVLDVGAKFTAKGNLSAKAALCLVPAVDALSEAAGNVQATGSVSASFASTIKLARFAVALAGGRGGDAGEAPAAAASQSSPVRIFRPPAVPEAGWWGLSPGLSAALAGPVAVAGLSPGLAGLSAEATGAALAMGAADSVVEGTGTGMTTGAEVAATGAEVAAGVVAAGSACFSPLSPERVRAKPPAPRSRTAPRAAPTRRPVLPFLGVTTGSSAWTAGGGAGASWAWRAMRVAAEVELSSKSLTPPPCIHCMMAS